MSRGNTEHCRAEVHMNGGAHCHNCDTCQTNCVATITKLTYRMPTDTDACHWPMSNYRKPFSYRSVMVTDKRAARHTQMTNRQIDRWTDKQTDGQTNRQTDKQTDGRTDGWIIKETAGECVVIMMQTQK